MWPSEEKAPQFFCLLQKWVAYYNYSHHYNHHHHHHRHRHHHHHHERNVGTLITGAPPCPYRALRNVICTLRPPPLTLCHCDDEQDGDDDHDGDDYDDDDATLSPCDDDQDGGTVR